MKRKPVSKHTVRRKTKSGKIITYSRGKGAKTFPKKSCGKTYAAREDDKYDKMVEQGTISAYEARLMREGKYGEEIKKLNRK